MTPEQLQQAIRRKAQELETYANVKFPTTAGNVALRFINGNFRAQGWQGNGFKKWDKNETNTTILVQSGHLRSANYYTTGTGKVTIKNTVPYANIHNEGGILNVPVTDKMRGFAWYKYFENTGNTSEGIEESPEARMWKGLALTKKTFLNIKIPQRQFFPTQTSKSPVLEKAVNRAVQRDVLEILRR